jgi:HEAT repeat protein
MSRDREPLIRPHAIEAIAMIRGEAAASALLDALNDERDPQTRSVILCGFGRIGPFAKAAVPALLDVLGSSKVEDERIHAARSLGYIGRAAVPGLTKLLSDVNQSVRARQLAIGALSTVARYDGAHAWDEAVSALIKTLSDHQLRSESLASLEDIGPPAQAAIPAVQKLLRDASADDRISIARCLFGIDRELGLSVVKEYLRNEDSTVRIQALGLFSEFGRKAQPAVPQLLQALNDTDVVVPAAAACTLGNVSANSDETVVQALTRAANEDENEEVREVAKRALEELERK